jgi:hypothetical protein
MEEREKGGGTLIRSSERRGELLRDLDGSLKPGERWRLKVKDATGAEIYELEFRTKVFS